MYKLGMGCWAIGGYWTLNGEPVCLGKTDDSVSIKAIEAAYETGIRLFDTAANYGAGLSERLIGKALGPKINDTIISTKLGFNVDEINKNVTPFGKEMKYSDVLPNIEKDINRALKRLNREYIDILFFHIWDYDRDLSIGVRDKLEEMVLKGKIKGYGWSIDSLELLKLWREKPNCNYTQAEVNIINPNSSIVKWCEESNSTLLNRTPLAMGFLSGKYSEKTLFSSDDVRSGDWVKDTYLKPALENLNCIREILTSNGRTLVQGALAWLWAYNAKNIPIPGIRSVKQAVENGRAMEFGPLTRDEYMEIEKILKRESLGC